MTRVGLRHVRSHLGRFALSVIAVLLGVAFVAGTFSLRAMMAATFDGIVEAGTDGDAYVQGETSESGDGMGFRVAERIPLELEDVVRDVDGVAGVVPSMEGPIVLVGADGTAVLSTGPPSFGMALHPDDRAVSIVDGRAPTGPDEIALETAALERSGLAIGDETTVVLGGQIRPVTVVGHVGFDAQMAGAIMVGLDVDTAREAYSPDGMTTLIAVYGDPAVDQETLSASVAGSLAASGAAPTIEVITGDAFRADAREQWQSMLGFISTFLLAFAGIALFVGAFIISNTFAMAVRQRQREFAMLRAVGCSPAQVFGSVLAQAAAIGVVGSALGIGAGVGLVAGLQQILGGMGMQMSGTIPIDGFTVTVSVLVGTVVSLVAAVVPARRAALTAPVEAMRDDVASTDRNSRVRAVTGALLLLAGTVAVVVATAGTGVAQSNREAALGLGAAAVVASVILLAPVVVPAVMGLLAAPAVHAMRPMGGLARGNLVRNPRRTAATGSALMIGMALVGAAAVIAASTQASVRDVVANETDADLLLQSATWDVPTALVGQVSELDGLARVDPLSVTYGARVDGEPLPVVGAPPGLFGQVLTVPVVDGDITTAAAGQALVMHKDAEVNGWQVGDVLTVAGPAGTAEVPIGAIIDSRAVDAPVVLPSDLIASVADPTSTTIDSVFLTAAPGADIVGLRAEVTTLAAPYVVVSVMDGEEFTDAIAEQINQLLVILYALLGLSIVIAVLGIVNTLALSISERTREIGLLRAVGLGRVQLSGVVTIESVLTAVFGTALGLLVGVGLASAIPAVYADDGFSVRVVPWPALTGLLGVAVVVGVVAAVWPAIRAARMDVLQAIAYE